MRNRKEARAAGLRPAAALLLLALAPARAFGDQPAGPNPASLSPAGAHGVSLFTGAFTYSYPIVVPPGRRCSAPFENWTGIIRKEA